MLRFLLSALILALSCFASAQESYDTLLLSSKQRAGLRRLDVFLRDSLNSVPYFADRDVESRVYKIIGTPSNKVALVMANHPHAQVRGVYLDKLVAIALKEKDTARIVRYLTRYVNDTAGYKFQHGCIGGFCAYGYECYQTLKELVPPTDLAAIEKLVLEAGIQKELVGELVHQIPRDEANYPIFEDLVYNKKQTSALMSLLSYHNPKDVSAPLAFVQSGNPNQEKVYNRKFGGLMNTTPREDAYWALLVYPSPANLHHFTDVLPLLLQNNWSYKEYDRYAEALEKYGKDTVLQTMTELAKAVPDTFYSEAIERMFTYFDDSLPADARHFLLERFAPSLQLGLEDGLFLMKNYPERMMRCIEFRLANHRGELYSDDSLNRTALKFYLNGSSMNKDATCLRALSKAYEETFDTCFKRLRENPENMALVKDRLYRRYENYVSQDKFDMRPDNTVHEAILELDDLALYLRLEPLVISQLRVPNPDLFDDYRILARSRTPKSQEFLINALRHPKYQYQLQAVIVGFVELKDPEINKLLVTEYNKAKEAKGYNPDLLGYFERLLQRYKLL